MNANDNRVAMTIARAVTLASAVIIVANCGRRAVVSSDTPPVQKAVRKGPALVSGDYTPPVPLDQPFPNLRGTPAHYRWPAEIELNINEQGVVVAARDLTGWAPNVEVAERVTHFKFRPATLRGKPVAATIKITIHQPWLESARNRQSPENQ